MALLRVKTVTLEVLTSFSVAELRRARWWNQFVPEGLLVRQAQADSIKPVGKRTRRRR